ncbi:aflatoxin biosynthesis ketoreductase-like protein nor-1 [Periconia macrospinosa]|uniref:Aflatoxin biosynthesis ketoreductase-like protein nor-1 n=1 Tax=Periconia macrospinosa TaxID=97972 RepID=A0A2V1DXR6_9PLEO|nr:aflatoxin biosynthesis ketoreductase-like protein nor-1 [Periconia macrospinosa]
MEPSSANGTVYLVTGANRGLGRGLVEQLLRRSSTTVVACVRSVSTSQASFQDLETGPNSRLVVVQLDCASASDPQRAVQELQSVHGITHIDVVIANAGIANDHHPASSTQLDQLEGHMMVNAFSILLLFQATSPLLQKSTHPPKFVYIGARLGAISDMDRLGRAPLAAYSLSKLAGNWLIRKLHFENEWLIAFIVDPGFVQTDMGNHGAQLLGRPQAETPIEDSARGILSRVDDATKASGSGQFVLWKDGSPVAW